MKRILITTLLLACIILTQGTLIAHSIMLDQPAASCITDAPADPNDGSGNE